MSPPATGPDTWVTLKVFHKGQTRRFKLRLRDLGASTLESKIQENLQIPDGITWTLERYSDSLANYVLLDTDNVAVYKQLYRAAKAKLKLKLRINIIKEETPETSEAEDVEAKGPKPASVEDEPELSQQETTEVVPQPTAESKHQQQEPEQLIPITPEARPLVDLEEALSRLESTLNLTDATEAMKREQSKITKNLDILEASVNALSKNMGDMNLGTDSGEIKRFRGRPIACVGGPLPLRAPNRTQQAQNIQMPVFTSCPATGTGYAVCCNICDKTIPGPHYHCATCDDGDFDLCLDCVQKGETCRGDSHWLIKRHVVDGLFINSTTVKLPRKLATKPATGAPAPLASKKTYPVIDTVSFQNVRTCNCCVRELPDNQFVHCSMCEDFDLCEACFKKDKHGHHPKHAFTPAVKDTVFSAKVMERLAPGRNQPHNAYCDGCDKRINGVRHKCLDCPDWDYCNGCVVNAKFIHPGHRFAPIYDHIEPAPCVNARAAARPMHLGIKCDGPLCQEYDTAYIRGVRYKCAVCHDTDFCENCEANPRNTHNKTHPLILFKTPVKFANVTTTGAHGNGRPMPIMGDKLPHARPIPITNCPAAASTRETAKQEIQKTDVLTVADVEPSLTTAPVDAVPVSTSANSEKLAAAYVRDLVADGTVLPPNHLFVQKWTLRNEGNVAWPAGCCVTVDNRSGCGDYMGVVNPTRPASVKDLIAAGMSSLTKSTVAPGEEVDFHVTLRTPFRQGRSVSYWRLTTPDGKHFGNRLWCDINVQIPQQHVSPPSYDVLRAWMDLEMPVRNMPAQNIAQREDKPIVDQDVKKADLKTEDVKPEVQDTVKSEAQDAVKSEVKEEEPAVVKQELEHAVAEPETQPNESAILETHESQMIFPKLDKESPIASIHEDKKEVEDVTPDSPPAYEDEYEECNEDDEWAEEEEDSHGFLTDEEYDVLDASDEEYLEEQQKKLQK